MVCPKCGYNDKREYKYGLVIEPSNIRAFGKWMAYREDGWLSCHFADTKEQVIENAMKELEKCLKT